MNRTKIALSVLIVISLLVGVFVFSLSTYRQATLNIDATSMEKGNGIVFFEGDGIRGSSSRTFEINEYPGDQGLKKLYVIELPAIKLKTITINPRILKGLFGVHRIILANDTISYTWDEQGVCSQQMQVRGFRKMEPCKDGAPGIVTAENSLITISSIPETGFTNTLGFRIAKAIAIAFGTFLSGVWLFMPSGKKTRTAFLHRFTAKLAWFSIASAFVYQLYLICRYSVDVPRQDEWMMYFNSDGLINGLTWRWLFGFQSEHPLFFTKLMAWLNLKLFDLDFALQNVLNFLIFGGVLVAVALIKNKMLGREKFTLFPLFMIFLLSPINWESHLWALQSNYHMVLLFSVLILHHAFSSELTVKSSILFCLYSVLALLTYPSGVIFVAIYLLCLTVYTVAGIKWGRIDRTTGWRLFLVACIICGVILYLWSFGREASSSHFPKVYPYEFKFWDFLLNVISLSFGFKQVHMLPGIVCISLVLLPPILLLMKKETRWQPATWIVLSAVLGMLAVLAAISFGRAFLYPSKTSRFVEMGFLLIPYTALGWWLVMKEGPNRIAMLTFLWIFCFVSFFDDWTKKGYTLYKQFSLYDLRNVEAYYSGAGKNFCPQLSTPAHLDRAKKLGVNFTRQFAPVSSHEIIKDR